MIQVNKTRSLRPRYPRQPCFTDLPEDGIVAHVEVVAPNFSFVLNRVPWYRLTGNTIPNATLGAKVNVHYVRINKLIN